MSIHCMMELNVIEEIYMFVDVLFSDPFRISDELGVDVSIVLCDAHIGDTHSCIALLFFAPRAVLLNTLREPQFVGDVQKLLSPFFEGGMHPKFYNVDLPLDLWHLFLQCVCCTMHSRGTGTHPSPLLTPSGGNQNMHGWQAVGMHPPGMLYSCWWIVSKQPLPRIPFKKFICSNDIFSFWSILNGKHNNLNT